MITSAYICRCNPERHSYLVSTFLSAEFQDGGRTISPVASPLPPPQTYPHPLPQPTLTPTLPSSPTPISVMCFLQVCKKENIIHNFWKLKKVLEFMESNYLLRGHLDKHYPQVSNLEMTQHISRNTVHKKNLKI